MRYYFIQAQTAYDGLEFTQSMVTSSKKELSNEEAHDIATDWLGHEDTYEEMEIFRLEEISETEFNILKKYL